MNKEKIKKLLKSRVLSVAASFCYAVYNGYLWFAKGYVFGGCICIYYFLLTLIRAAVIVLKSGEDKKGIPHARAGLSAALFLLNFALAAPVALMVFGKRSYELGLIPAITMATYATYKITIAIIRYKKFDKYGLPAVMRSADLTDALVSVLTLQNALIIATEGSAGGSMKTLTAYTSGAIFALITAISAITFIRAIKYRKTIKNSVEPQADIKE